MERDERAGCHVAEDEVGHFPEGIGFGGENGFIDDAEDGRVFELVDAGFAGASFIDEDGFGGDEVPYAGSGFSQEGVV